MDQPVVVLERLPESVIEKHTQREEMKVFDYNYGCKIIQNEGFSDKYAHKKQYWIKSGGLNSGFYNKPNFHSQSNHKLLANGYHGNSKNQTGNDTYNKADTFHPRKIGNDFIVNHNQVLNSQHQQNTSAQFTPVLGNTMHFSNNQDNVVSNEQVLRQGKKRHRSSEKKMNRKDSFSTSEEYYEDVNENEELDSYDWQIISEASCSDISRDSSPSRENLLDAEYSGHTELKDNETPSELKCKLNDTLTAASGMETNLLKWQDITQPQKKINQVSESDDDRSTEPYRSDCEEDIDKEENDTKYTKPCKSHIRIKLAGSHKNGFTNITDKSNEGKVVRSNKKGNITAELCVKPESICSNTSSNHSACPADIAVNKTINKESTDHDGVANTVQKKQTILPLADNNTHCANEGKSAKTNLSQLDGLVKREDLQRQTAEKSELANATHPKCLSNAENRTENCQNGQNTANKESKFNRYDYVGLIMKTMDKSAPFSVPAKSGEMIQKSSITDESQTLSFKPNGINKQPNYKEAVMLPSKKEVPAIACFKQKKARMSRVTSMSKSFLCRDLKGTVLNKTEYVNYGSRPTEMSLKENIKIKGDNEKICRNVDTVSNIMNSSNKIANTQALTDKQGVKVLGAKAHRICWRCGKQLSNNNIVTDRLCKQCNAIDYTTVAPKLSDVISNNKSNDVGKETSPTDSISPSDPCSSKKSLKMYHVKNLSEKQSPEWSKASGNATSLQNKYISTIHQEEQVETGNASLSSLKFVVSLGSNKFVEKTSKDMVTVDAPSKKVKKKRMRSASDTVEGTYEKKKHVTAITRQTSDGNLICKISKKRRKHKDLLKRKKKPKLEIEEGSSDVSDGRNQSSDVSGYHSEDNITSRCTPKDCNSEHSELSLNHPPMNQSENTDVSNNRNSKGILNKAGNCEVRNVNRGLFLVSFSETDDNLYQIQSGLCERSKIDSNQTVTEQLKSSSNLGQKLGSPQVVNHKLSSPDAKTSDSICHKESCPTLADLQALVDKQQPVTAIHSQETAVSDDSLSLENKTEAKKITLPESDHIVCEDDSESKLSMPIIESVYSLKDVKAENESDGKRTKIKMPFLYNHNIYNELDAYTTASILDMDGTKERSLTVLMSLLSREYNELRYIHQAAKKTGSIDVELQNEKLRHIDNIRTLQLACALFKQCQKCNKELSPEMLKLKPQEIALLLTECGNDMNTDSSTEERSNLDTDIVDSLKLGTKDKREENKALSGDGDSVTNGISGETKTSKLAMHTTNSRKTVRFLLDQKLLESSNASATISGISIPAVKQKSDDDVIYLGVSQLPRSSTQVTQALDQETVPQNDVSSSIQSPEAINSKTKNNQNIISISPSVVPPNVSVIKSHIITSPPATSNFISSSSGSIPLQVIPAQAVNHPLQVAVSVVTSGAAYQKTAVGYGKHPNYSLPSNSLSIVKESNNTSKQEYVVSQLSKLPNGTSWIPSGVQNQWSSHPSQVIQTSAATNEALGNIRNQAWRNTSPIQSGTPPSVADQQKPMQQMSVAPNAMVPLMNQYGTAVATRHGIHGGLPMPAPRSLPPVPPMYHSTARSWHQTSNPLNAALRPTQTPVVCIACRKPIGMTCPTGMFCSDLCKKSYCARFPNYR